MRNIKTCSVATQAVTSYQAGSLKQKGKSWYSLYRVTLLTNGKRERKLHWENLGSVLDFPHESQAQLLHDAHMLKVNGGGAVSRQFAMSVAEYFRSTYSIAYLSKHLSKPTQVSYQRGFNKYLLPRIGDLRMTEVRPFHITRMLQAILDDNPNLAHGTLKLIKSITSSVFQYAFSEGATDINPVRGARLPKGGKPKRERPIWTLAQVWAALRILRSPVKEVFAIAIFGGLRIGEIAALRWEDYKRSEKGELVLDIKRSVDLGSSHELLNCKNAAARKPVPVIPTLKTILDEYRRTALPSTGGWMFPAPRTPEHPINARNLDRDLKKVAGIVGVEDIGWHDLRHSAATILKHLGVDDFTIQRVMRHGDVSTTRAIYIHATDQSTERAMQEFEKAVRSQAEALDESVQ